jgi:hypothetical protein
MAWTAAVCRIAGCRDRARFRSVAPLHTQCLDEMMEFCNGKGCDP